MSYGYLIGPIEPSLDFNIDVDEFATKLKERWPDAEIEITPNVKLSLLKWLLPNDIHPTFGAIQNQHTVAIHGGPIDKITEFAIWYRSTISLQHRLYFYISHLELDPMEITTETTAHDIMAVFG